MKFVIEMPYELAVKLKNSGVDPLEILKNAVKTPVIGDAVEPESPARQNAKTWLAEELFNGPVLSAVVLGRAKMAGVPRRALDYAKRSLKVQIKKKGFQGAWVWSLPDDSPHSRITSKKRAASILLELYGGYDTMELLEVYKGTEARGVTRDAVNAAIEFLNWSTAVDSAGIAHMYTHNLV